MVNASSYILSMNNNTILLSLNKIKKIVNSVYWPDNQMCILSQILFGFQLPCY